MFQKKTITLFGWAFKKDTNDSRESAAIYVANILIENGAKICVYDPRVTEQQMLLDLDKLNTRSSEENRNALSSFSNYIDACNGSEVQLPLLQNGMNWRIMIGNKFTRC